jgi:CheY-like chemotaxis protein/nitrogen-specific signal transduction histidine kinase
MLGATIDVTERRKLEETQRRLLASERAARSDAERASNLKDEFLATLSHELRTPLSAILGWSQLLQSGRLSEKDHDEGLAVIERNARMQKQLIEDLLDVSRIITGKFRLEVQSVQLIDVASAALDTLRPSIEAKEIQLVTSFDSSLPLVRGDPARLQQVVWNLLTNAVKFTPRGGRVELAVRREGSQIELSVTDTGLGIEPEFLSQLFQRFRQADASTTRRHGGLGLGLAICKHIIELHGGNVAAESEGHGKGARFIVRLPIPALETAGGAADAAPGGETGPTESLRNVRVLMLDDDLDSQRLVTRILEATQASVTPVSSATEALELLERETFDIVISDIGMPNIDGYMFIQRVRSAANGKHRLPAVALTAFARPEDRRHALEAGFDRFLSKPIEAAELQATVKELLEQTVSH